MDVQHTGDGSPQAGFSSVLIITAPSFTSTTVSLLCSHHTSELEKGWWALAIPASWGGQGDTRSHLDSPSLTQAGLCVLKGTEKCKGISLSVLERPTLNFSWRSWGSRLNPLDVRVGLSTGGYGLLQPAVNLAMWYGLDFPFSEPQSPVYKMGITRNTTSWGYKIMWYRGRLSMHLGHTAQ